MPDMWEDIISFYRERESSGDWFDFVSMEALIKRIMENRDVSNIYPCTSLYALVLSKHKTYDEGRGEPTVLIRAASTTNYQFTLNEPLESGEIGRVREETISCRMDYALKAYDEMIARLEGLESGNPREA
jgi:hypothetical protein